jgi:hypothetical protein
MYSDVPTYLLDDDFAHYLGVGSPTRTIIWNSKPKGASTLGIN